MTGDVGPRENSRARRPGGMILLALAVLLLLGGGTAVAVGVASQDADPPVPSATRSSAPSTPGGATSTAPDETVKRLPFSFSAAPCLVADRELNTP